MDNDDYNVRNEANSDDDGQCKYEDIDKFEGDIDEEHPDLDELFNDDPPETE